MRPSVSLAHNSSEGAVEVDPTKALREYWDRDSATYDRWPEHGAWSQVERAAWAATLAQHLPKRGAKVLDVGAGTGFLSLVAARQGYEVTALDVSPGMLSRLEETAAREDLAIEVVCSSADEPPSGPFDAVMERLLLWTLPDPQRALEAWHAVVPDGPLLAFEAFWSGRDYREGVLRRGRKLLRKARRLPPEHHAPYPGDLLAQLPHVASSSPEALTALIQESSWRTPKLFRLRDVEWSRELVLPPVDRLLGVTPEYVLTASSS